ncbi:polyketide synthase [Diaporthe eres]|nr:polyketide synthase [Diaporthe eres]
MAQTDRRAEGIAVVGMACRFPGANSLEEFWNILDAGLSMAADLGSATGRFPSHDHPRRNDKSVFAGNILKDVSSFGIRVFRKSGREAASMDPQQRILLEVAYQALESWGYFTPSSTPRESNVGCFVGTSSCDYVDNVASHPPNAFSATGMLRAFLSGNISHFFGFTGPSFTFDTACSSSAVAIDAASKALLAGDCTSALAGGVNIFSSPHLYQNLAAASFLSPDGATNLLMRVPMDTAASSNKVPITVPYRSSQIELYRGVLRKAGVSAQDVTYLEAHGTGTPIGDLREFAGIKEIFGGRDRQMPLFLASLKGNIGHTEEASRVAGLIKVLLMMQKDAIPRQTNYRITNPQINLIEGQIQIPTQTETWHVSCPTACISNYGAAGSIAAMVVRGPDLSRPEDRLPKRKLLSKYPVVVTAISSKSLRENCAKLRQSLPMTMLPTEALTLADTAFNICDRQNISLPHIYATTVSSIAELDQELHVAESHPAGQALPDQTNEISPRPNPVVLVFGGQSSRQLALNRNVYHSSVLLQKYLDECNDALVQFGYERGLYPGLFDSTPTDDVVSLQTKQFALQYACARVWIDCGLEVKCVIGHSFGQLVALTVAVGSVSEVNTLVHVIRSTASIKYKVLDVTHGLHSRLCDSIHVDLERLASSLVFNPPKIHLETCSGFESWSEITAKYIANYTRDPVYFGEAVSRVEALYGMCTWLEAGSDSSVNSMVRRVLTNRDQKGHFYYPVDLSRDDAMDTLADTTASLWKRGHSVQFWPFHRAQRQSYSQFNLPPYQFEKRDHWLDFNLTSQQNVPANPSVDQAPCNKPDPLLIAFSGFEDAHRRHSVFTIDTRCGEWKTLVLGHAVLEQPVCPASLYVELVQRATKSLSEDRELPAAAFSRFSRLKIVSPLGLNQDGDVLLKVSQSDHAGLRWNFEFHAGTRSFKSTQRTTKHAYGEIEITSWHDNVVDNELQRYRRVLQHSRFESLISHENSEAIQGNSVYNMFSRVVKYHDFYRGIRRLSALEGTIAAQVVLKDQPPALLHGLLTNPVALDNFLQVPGLYLNCMASFPPQDAFVCVQVQSLQLSSDFLLSSSWDVFATCTPTNSNQQHTCDIFATDTHTGKLVFVALEAEYERAPIALFAKTLSRGEKRNLPHKTDALSLAWQVDDEELDAPDSISSSKGMEQTAGGKVTLKSSMESRGVHNRSTEAFTPSESTSTSSKTTSSVCHQREQMERKFLSLLSEMIGVAPEDLAGESSLDDLGIDSLLMMEVASEIDSAFGISIHQDALQSLVDVDSVVDYLSRYGANLLRGPADEFALPPQLKNIEVTATTTSSPRNQPLSSETPTESSGNTSTKPGDVASQLSKILGIHLECSTTEFQASTDLADKGLDSLLWMEVISDIEKIFDVTIDLSLTGGRKYGDLCVKLVQAIGRNCSSQARPPSLSSLSRSDEIDTDSTKNHFTSVSSANSDSSSANPGNVLPFINTPDHFESIKPKFDELADKHHFKHFFEEVYEKNSRLVLAYTVEAFVELGVHLDTLTPGDTIPLLDVLPRHCHLREVLYEILRDGGLTDYNGKCYVRSETPMQPTHSNALFKQIVSDFPRHAKEHTLLDICGSNLAKLLTGSLDSLKLIFGTKANRDTLEDALSNTQIIGDGVSRIIELGAGFGSTTRWVMDRLVQQGVRVEYTFTDISSSLVSAAKRKFQKYDCMKYSTINIELEPPSQYRGQFDVVLSSNCIHATRNLPVSLENINKLLRPHGFVALVEFTSRMFWFDLVFGLLEGWWRFDDGRDYVLARPEFWDKCLRESGFQHVSWTGGSTRESEVVRLITGFKQPVRDPRLFRSIPQADSWPQTRLSPQEQSNRPSRYP